MVWNDFKHNNVQCCFSFHGVYLTSIAFRGLERDLMHIHVFVHGVVSLVPNLQLIETVTALLIQTGHVIYTS